MTTQFATPLLLKPDGTEEQLVRLSLSGASEGTFDEAWLQEFLFTHADALPVREIDSSYADPVPICREMHTSVGPIDVLYVTSEGRLVIAEAKLWRNPEARRKVIGQILDYASVLSNWTYEDLEREVIRRSGRHLYQMVADMHPGLDEADFIDNVSRSLREGRFLLLVCGDGIREGLNKITSFLDRYTSLDLTFGLVELAVFAMRDGARLVQPRVLAKTVTIRRQVLRVEGVEAQLIDENEGPERSSVADEHRDRMKQFWEDFLKQLRLDDQSQPLPNPARQSHIQFRLHSQSAWVTCYFNRKGPEIGVFVTFSQGEPGDTFWRRLCDERDTISAELPSDTEWKTTGSREHVIRTRPMPDITNPEERKAAIQWFTVNINLFINAFRPRIGLYHAEL